MEFLVAPTKKVGFGRGRYTTLQVDHVLKNGRSDSAANLDLSPKDFGLRMRGLGLELTGFRA